MDHDHDGRRRQRSQIRLESFHAFVKGLPEFVYLGLVGVVGVLGGAVYLFAVGN